MCKGKYETITIRTTEQEKQALQTIADKERRPLGALVYNWVIDRLEKEQNKQ